MRRQRASAHDPRRVVIKLGTRVVMRDQGHLAMDRLFWVVSHAARLLGERPDGDASILEEYGHG